MRPEAKKMQRASFGPLPKTPMKLDNAWHALPAKYRFAAAASQLPLAFAQQIIMPLIAGPGFMPAS